MRSHRGLYLLKPVSSGGGTTPVTPPASDTQAAQLAAAHSGLKSGYLDAAGRIIRKDQGGDIISEAQAYYMKNAVLQNDKPTFDLVRTWSNANLKRSLPGSGKTTFLNTWAWHANPSGTSGVSIIDWNLASDADFDRYEALEGAIARGWDTDGSIAAECVALAADLKGLLLIDGNYAIQVTDEYQMSVAGTGGHHTNGAGVVAEINVSYFNFNAYRLLKRRTGDTVWDKARAGALYVLGKCMDNAGTLATTAGLPPNWCYYDTGTHDVGPLTAGTAGWSYTRDTQYTYDAFRTFYRLYTVVKYWNDTDAAALLSGAAKTYFTSRWNSNGNKIAAELNHDGSIANNYEKNFFTGAARFCLSAGDSSNTTAAAMASSKLSNLLVTNTNSFGTYQFFRSDPSGSSSSYYGDSWMYYYFAIEWGAYSPLILTSALASSGGSSGGGRTDISPRWKLVFDEDFPSLVAEGSMFAVQGDHAKGLGAYAQKWGAQTYKTTYGSQSGSGDYYGINNMSVVSGIAGANGNCLQMRLYIDSSGKKVGCNPYPNLSTPGASSASSAMPFGRWEVRYLAEAVKGWKTAWMIWPGSWQWDFEIDWVEGDLNGHIGAFDHWVSPSHSASQADGYSSSSGLYTAWHTSVLEWTPSSVKFILDGVTLGTSVNRSGVQAVPTADGFCMLQTENSLSGGSSQPTAPARLWIDYIAGWQYQAA